MMTGMPKRAVVLAGGLGARLRPYTAVIPKPLMPVGDRPVLDIVLRQLRAAGVERVTIATGYLAELIEAFCGNGGAYDLQIDYFREREPLGTVGALASIDGLDESFMVMNGDVLTDMDFERFFTAHLKSGAAATIATTTRVIEVSLGVMRFDDADDPARVTDYIEKPNLTYEASMGVYAFHPRVLPFIEPEVRLDFPDLILRLIAAGEEVRAHRPRALLAGPRPPRGLRAGDGRVRGYALAATTELTRSTCSRRRVGGEREREVALGGCFGVRQAGVVAGELRELLQRGVARRLDARVRERLAHPDPRLHAVEQHREREVRRAVDVVEDRVVEALAVRRGPPRGARSISPRHLRQPREAERGARLVEPEVEADVDHVVGVLVAAVAVPRPARHRVRAQQPHARRVGPRRASAPSRPRRPRAASWRRSSGT